MVLWTIQPIEIYELIQETGVYHCNFTKSMLNDCREQYDWLAQEMKTRIGNPPEGVSYPVWAWYMWEGERKKPDLRRERWETAGKANGLPVWRLIYQKQRLSCRISIPGVSFCCMDCCQILRRKTTGLKTFKTPEPDFYQKARENSIRFMTDASYDYMRGNDFWEVSKCILLQEI